MLPDFARPGLPGGPGYQKISRFLCGVLVLWTLLFVVVGIRGYWQPRKNSVYPAYHQAGLHFSQQEDLYGRQDKGQGIDVFRYTPAFAAMMEPFGFLPENLGGALWRVVQGALLLGSLIFLAGAVPRLLGENRPVTSTECAWFLLAAFPLSLTSINNAQINPIVTAGILISCILAWRGNWAWAGIVLAIPVFLKIFPISVFLLLALVGPWRFALAFGMTLGGLFLFPFGFAPTDYVFSQYQLWWSFLGKDDRHYWALEAGYRDLWMVLRVIQSDPPVWVYQIIQAAFGGLCALGVLWFRLKNNPGKAIEAALVLGTGWMMLCGPSTESSTYTLFSPVLGILFLRVRGAQANLGANLFFWLGALLLMSGVFAGLFPQTGRFHSMGVQPLGALLVCLSYVANWVSWNPLRSFNLGFQDQLARISRADWSENELGTQA